MKNRLHRMPPTPLFFIGLATVPAFVFQESLVYRPAEAGLFLLLCILAGKRIRPLPAAALLFSVTAASLLVPYGEVFARVFGFPLTVGALKFGLSRGILLLGLFYLSKFSVGPGLSLPGALGRGVGRVFYYFERFSESREKISLADLPGSLDEALTSVSRLPAGEQRATSKDTRPALLLIPLAAGAACWVLLFI